MLFRVAIFLEFVGIQLFSLQLWVCSRTDWIILFWFSNQSKRVKTLNSNLLKNWPCVTSYRCISRIYRNWADLKCFVPLSPYYNLVLFFWYICCVECDYIKIAIILFFVFSIDTFFFPLSPFVSYSIDCIKWDFFTPCNPLSYVLGFLRAYFTGIRRNLKIWHVFSFPPLWIVSLFNCWTDFGLELPDVIFYIIKGETPVIGEVLVDSIIMNLGKDKFT